MAPTKLRSKHALGLGLICAACAVTICVLYLSGFIRAAGNHPLRFLVGDANHPKPALANAYRRYEAETTQRLQIYGRAAKMPENVVFLAIDTPSVNVATEDTPEEIARSRALHLMKNGFPYPRQTYALILERLVKAGAKVVCFDIHYDAPKEGDEELKAALDEYKDHVVFGINFDSVETDLANKPVLITPPSSLIGKQNPLLDDRLGIVNVRLEEEDQTVRYYTFRTSMLEWNGLPPQDGAPELFSLAAQAARKAGYDSLVPAEHGGFMLRYLRDLHPLSLHEIFIDRLWQHPPYNNGAVFKDKIVFIGPLGNWIKDEQITPFGLMNGPKIHLSALACLLNRDFLEESSLASDLIIILGAGLLAWIISVRVSDPLVRTVTLFLAAGLYVGAAFLIYNQSGLQLKLLSPNLSLLSGGFIGLYWERRAEKAERERVRRTLERYVSKDVVKEVLDNPASYLNVTGVSRKPITILFSDVRGFTSLTESGDAALLVAQLNEYFSEMVRIVFANLGTLDKFMGDAVVASWGAIVSRGAGADASRAVMAALDMLRSLKKLNAGWKERGLGEFHIGIGVNHGDAICGNIGSHEKSEFTAIGDTVNTASRIEGATKKFHVELLIGEATAELVRSELMIRSVDFLKLQGKTKPVEVFTVLDHRENGNARPAWLDSYEEGIRLYRQRQFEQAEACFTAAVSGAPDDWLCQEYLRRAQAYIATPPAPDWDGVFVVTSK